MNPFLFRLDPRQAWTQIHPGEAGGGRPLYPSTEDDSNPREYAPLLKLEVRDRSSRRFGLGKMVSGKLIHMGLGWERVTDKLACHEEPGQVEQTSPISPAPLD